MSGYGGRRGEGPGLDPNPNPRHEVEMAWFHKDRTPKTSGEQKKSRVPNNIWIKCNNCQEIIYRREVENNANVCPKCNYHFRISARERLQSLYDERKYAEFDGEVESTDPLKFIDTKKYKDRLRDYQKKSGEKEAVLNSYGDINGMPVIISAMEYNFMGGSMGSAVGEKITRAIEAALQKKVPLLIISCSGGARMQEGILSLMQMAKISAALARLHEEGIPYLSILTDPTTGGVTASFAMLGDMNIAEPKALIGFAGPRVIEQTIKQKLPEGFQRSEFLLEHGMLDMVVERKDLKQMVTTLIDLLYYKKTAPSGKKK